MLVEQMLEKGEGACLTSTQAYNTFCKLSQQRQLGQLKRSMFKEIMRELVSDGLVVMDNLATHEVAGNINFSKYNPLAVSGALFYCLVNIHEQLHTGFRISRSW